MNGAPLTVSIASVSDREALVGEVWCGDTQVAEVRTEGGAKRISIFPAVVPWDFALEEFLAAIARASEGA